MCGMCVCIQVFAYVFVCVQVCVCMLVYACIYAYISVCVWHSRVWGLGAGGGFNKEDMAVGRNRDACV